MRIHIQGNRGSKTGRDHFFDRLSGALTALGEVVTRNPSEAHNISLQAIFIEKTNAKKYVLRLNGVHHNLATNYKKVNRSIVDRGIKNADAIVYQSDFSRLMCNRYLGGFSGRTTIISNGANPKDFKAQPMKVKHKNVIFTASRWRPHKRLVDMIESFLLANIKDSVLFVAGDLTKSGFSKEEVKKYAGDLKVVFTGILDQKTLHSYLKVAKAFVHLTWFDNCPNSVVEAIASGTPVITNNVGGTHEIVRPSGGFVLDIDEPYDLKPCYLYKPPPIDRKKVAEAIKLCCNKKQKVNSSFVNIKVVAEQYRDFFRRVLDD